MIFAVHGGYNHVSTEEPMAKFGKACVLMMHQATRPALGQEVGVQAPKEAIPSF